MEAAVQSVNHDQAAIVSVEINNIDTPINHQASIKEDNMDTITVGTPEQGEIVNITADAVDVFVNDSLPENEHNMESAPEEGSSGTAVPFDHLGNPTINMYTADIPRRQLKQFLGLPDTVSKSEHPIPLAIPRDDVFWVVGRYDIVAKVTDPDQAVRVLVDVKPDSSDMSIAFEKWGYMDRPLGGGVSGAEQIWLTAHFPPLMAADPNINVLAGRGGVRKGPKYNEGSFLKKLIAKRLNRPEEVVQKYLSHGKYIDIDTLRIFAEKRLERRFFESISSKKTALLASMKDKTDAYKTEQVSKNVMFWMDKYIANEAARVAESEAKRQADKAARAAKAAELKKTGGTKKTKPAVNAAPREEQDNQHKSEEYNGDERVVETLKNENDDAVVTTDHDSSSKAVNTPGAAFKFLPEDAMTSSDIFAEIFKLGKKLTDISENKPQPQELCQQLRAIIGGLNKIMTSLAEDQDSSTATILAKAA